MKKKTLLLILAAVAVVAAVVIVLILCLRKPHTPDTGTVTTTGEVTQGSLVEPDDRGETTRLVTPQQTTPRGLPTTASTDNSAGTPTDKGQTTVEKTTAATGSKATGGTTAGTPTSKTNASGLTEDQDASGTKYGEIF